MVYRTIFAVLKHALIPDDQPSYGTLCTLMSRTQLDRCCSGSTKSSLRRTASLVWKQDVWSSTSHSTGAYQAVFMLCKPLGVWAFLPTIIALSGGLCWLLGVRWLPALKGATGLPACLVHAAQAEGSSGHACMLRCASVHTFMVLLVTACVLSLAAALLAVAGRRRQHQDRKGVDSISTVKGLARRGQQQHGGGWRCGVSRWQQQETELQQCSLAPCPRRNAPTDKESCLLGCTTMYDNALWAALGAVHGLQYRPVTHSCQVHLRLAGLEPGQLQLGWQAHLSRLFASRGWCVLNSAVRRGSICISFTLAGMRFFTSAASASAAAGSAAEGQGAAARGPDHSSGGGSSDGSANSSYAPVDACAASLQAALDCVASVLSVPEQLLASLGLRREELPEGFSITVQAVADDGRCHRVCYKLQPDNCWTRELLPSGFGEVHCPNSLEDASGSTASPDRTALPADAAESNAPAGADAPDVSKKASGSTAEHAVSREEALLPPLMATAASWTAAAPGAAREWHMDAPLVLMGVPEPQGAGAGFAAGAAHAAMGTALSRGVGAAMVSDGAGGEGWSVQRYEAIVRTRPSLPAAVEGRGAPADGGGADGSCNDVSAMELFGPDDVAHLEIQAQLLGMAGEVSELHVEHTFLGGVIGDKGHSLLSCGSHVGAGHSGSGLETAAAVAEAASQPAMSDALHSAEASVPGGIWHLVLRQQQPSPHTATPLATSELTWRKGFRSVSGTTSNAAAAGALPLPSWKPQLVDLSLWRGRELLAARVVLLIPSDEHDSHRHSGHAAAFPRGSSEEQGRLADRPWADELRQLLSTQPADAAQNVLIDLGLLLSGAFENLAFRRCVRRQPSGLLGAGMAAAGALAAASEEPSGGATRDPASDQQTLLILDLGCGLLSLVLKHGACSLAKLLWRSLEELNFGAEEVLLHASGIENGLPLLHAAVTSGELQPVQLVLTWYTAACVPEPWLQPVRLGGSPAVLTPLVLASASVPPGFLLSYILRNHPQALAAWRVPVNGASGRSAAVAAGLWRTVLAEDARMALSPAAAAAAALCRWWRREPRRQAATVASFSTQLPCEAGGLSSENVACGLEGGPASKSGSTAAFPTVCDVGGSSVGVSGSSWRAMDAATGPKAAGVRSRRCGLAAAAAALGKSGMATPSGVPALDLDRFVAQRTRALMLGFQCAIILNQTLSQLKAIVSAFGATCPAPAAAAVSDAGIGGSSGGWAWLAVVRATGRCVVGRLWWTAVEAAVAAAVAVYGLKRYTACCVVLTFLRCAFQGGDGVLLPPSEMNATGWQMAVAHVLFVFITACCNQPCRRVNLVLRLMEGLAASHMYLKYGVTNDAKTAVVRALAVNLMGWCVSAMLRGKAAQSLRLRQERQLLKTREASATPRPATANTGSSFSPSAVDAGALVMSPEGMHVKKEL
ncbi:hypothetical protein Agub_g3501 [Astrephomene gubernaculifera]|uniref:Uncharacterized protein n=1 Tax=Astrephomene gubernaculifera TaxID=47775 RepID=A0AAD3HIH8_9CHLO|nr:hypothetical protein Agub_g3501 [Astrephomene gubernaculifera]